LLISYFRSAELSDNAKGNNQRR